MLLEEQEEKEEKSEKSEDKSEEKSDNQAEIDAETFQIAWEWLDTARVILTKELEKYNDDKDDSDAKVKILYQYSDVLSSLGQLGLETDNAASAKEDLILCLELREKILPSIDRTLAETHFYLGVAYQLNQNLNEALAEFDKAKIIITKILDDQSLSNGAKIQLKSILSELDTKFTETQQLLSGVDSANSADIKRDLAGKIIIIFHFY